MTYTDLVVGIGNVLNQYRYGIILHSEAQDKIVSMMIEYNDSVNNK